MIKGEIEEITLRLSAEEIKALIKQHHEQQVINVMGKRYFLRGFDCPVPSKFVYSGDNKTKVTVSLRAIKKG